MTNSSQISAFSVTLVVVSACIGTGIFFTPPEIARLVPNPSWVLFIWFIGFLHAIAGALVCSRFAHLQPDDAGIPFFLQKAYGGATGFVYGWTYLIFLIPGLVAAFSIGIVRYINPVMDVWVVKGLSAAIVLLVTIINLCGLAPSAYWNAFLTFLKIAGLLLISIAGFYFSEGAPVFRNILEHGTPGLNELGLAFVGVAFSFSGIQYGTFLIHLTKNKARNIMGAFLGGISIVGGLYLLVNLSYLYVFPLEELAVTASPAALILDKSPVAGYMIFIIVAIAVVGSMSAIVLSVPRMIDDLKAKNLFSLPRFALINEIPEKQVFPVLLCLVSWIWIIFWDAFYLILQHVVLAEVIFKILLMIAYFKSIAVHNRTFINSAAAIFHMGISLGLAIVLCVQRPLAVLLTGTVFLVGFVLHRFRRLPVQGAVNKSE